MTHRILPAMLAFAALAACGKASEPAPQPSADAGSVDPGQASAPAGTARADPKIDAPIPTDAWIGKWVGVEGLALDIARGATPGTYRLTIALMDGTARYDGAAVSGRIAFTRDGATEHIARATGAQTGLKWLADKQDCLVIKPGEGFCRG